MYLTPGPPIGPGSSWGVHIHPFFGGVRHLMLFVLFLIACLIYKDAMLHKAHYMNNNFEPSARPRLAKCPCLEVVSRQFAAFGFLSASQVFRLGRKFIIRCLCCPLILQRAPRLLGNQFVKMRERERGKGRERERKKE